MTRQSRVEVGNWLTAMASAVAMLFLSVCAAIVQAQRAVEMSSTEALRVE